MDLQEQLNAVLPPAWKLKCTRLTPFRDIHMISFEALAACPGAAKQQADFANMAIQSPKSTMSRSTGR